MVEQLNDEENVDDEYGPEEPSVGEGAPRPKAKDDGVKNAGVRVDWGSSAPYISLQVVADRHVQPRRHKNSKQGR